MTLRFQILSARELVEKFYSRLGQRPTRAKREKSIQESLDLLREGFTVEEVDYAISWLIEHHPTTGSFARLIHFIDQALKERLTEQHKQETHHQQMLEADKQRIEQHQIEVERQQIEAIKAGLSAERLAEFHVEAQELVEEEAPNVKLGRDMLIRLKVDELVRSRYL